MRVRVRFRVGARLWAVVVDEEVVVYLAPLHLHRGRAGAHRRQEGLPVPRVEGPVVPALAAGREDEIVRDLVAPAEAVVGVDAGARPVEEDVARHERLRRLGLCGGGAAWGWGWGWGCGCGYGWGWG